MGVMLVRAVEFAATNTFEYEPSYILRGLQNLDLNVRRKVGA